MLLVKTLTFNTGIYCNWTFKNNNNDTNNLCSFKLLAC